MFIGVLETLKPHIIFSSLKYSMPYINVTRSGEVMNSSLRFKVMIDGKKAGEVADDESQKIQVDAGKHTIKIKMQLWSSPELTFDATSDAERSFYVRSNKTAAKMFVIYMLFIAASSALIFIIPIWAYIIISVAMLVIAIRYAVIKRDQYLELQCTDQVVEYSSTGAIF